MSLVPKKNTEAVDKSALECSALAKVQQCWMNAPADAQLEKDGLVGEHGREENRGEDGSNLVDTVRATIEVHGRVLRRPEDPTIYNRVIQ